MQVVVGIMMTQLNAGGINMKTSLQTLGWNAQTLGMGEKWKGWMMRMTMYAEFSETQDPNTVVVFVDAYDALATRSPEGFQELFESFGCDLVIGAENFCGTNCSPVSSWWKQSNLHPTNGNLYVQGGCVVGRAHALSKMYRWILDQNIHDDQLGISAYVNHGVCDSVTLDYENKICFHDNYGQTGTFSLDASIVTVTRDLLVTNPYFVHFPGFLVWRAWPLIHTTKVPDLLNYNFVARHILKQQFVEIGQVDTQVYTTGNIVSLVLMVVLFVVAWILLVDCIRLRYQVRRLKMQETSEDIKKQWNSTNGKL